MAQRLRGEDYTREILKTIRAVRKEHHACTAREVARRLQVSHPMVNSQLAQLRAAGLVESTLLPGGIWLTDKGGKVASGGKMPPITSRKTAASRPRRVGEALSRASEPSSLGDVVL